MKSIQQTGFLILMALLFITCKPKKETTNIIPEPKPNIEMSDLKGAWKKVDSLVQQGLTRSALDEVMKIKSAALSESQYNDIVRAVLFENQFRAVIEEETREKTLSRIENDIISAPEPAKSVLHSIIAEYYTNYLQQNLYQLRSRTETGGQAPEDVRLWSIGHFVDTISTHYFASVENEITQSFPIDSVVEILTDQSNTDLQRPTLYDILAHRAIDYFMNDRAFLTQPIYRFAMSDLALFGQTDAFMRMQLGAQENEANKLQTLRLFQRVLKFHQDQDNAIALLDADLKRLKFVFDHIVNPAKQEAYLAALEQLADSHRGNANSTEADFRRSELYYQLGRQYDANRDTTNRYALKTAHQIATDAIARFPKSSGAEKCRRLIDQIERGDFQTQVEKVILPGEEILGFVSYQNTTKLYYRVAKITAEQFRDFNGMRNDQIQEAILKLAPVSSGFVDLIQTDDYQKHAQEFGVENPGLGMYVLIVSNDDTFRKEKLSMQEFHISRLAHYELNEQGQSGQFVVVDRKDGAPKSNVQANFYTSEYRPRQRNYEIKKVGSATSDQNGFLIPNLTSAQDGRSFLVELIDGEDRLMLDEYFSRRLNVNRRQRFSTTHFFTDRSIYRPGQTIFFKGYLVNTDEKGMPSIEANREVVIDLYDVNQQKKGSVTLRSNEFGTVQGSFVIPSGGLTGQMSLRSNFGRGQHYFSVEEYKRPKFEVEFLPIIEQYRLGDPIVAKGEAKNYAGTAVDGAVVRYRIERVKNLPYWRYRYGRYFPRTQDRVEIAFGEITTDDSGQFEIPFDSKLQNPEEVDPDVNYTFNVYADVVDISGETRSAMQSLTLGQKSFKVDVNIDDLLPKAQSGSIGVHAKNLNGQNVKVDGQCTISKLSIPQKSYRDRYWAMPDQLTISKAEYSRRFQEYLFPGDERMENWRVIQDFDQFDFQVDGKDTIDLSTNLREAGAYRFAFEFRNDQGDQIERVYFAIIYDLKSGDIPAYVKFVEEVNGAQFEPGSTLTHVVGSGMPNTPNVLHTVDRQNRKLQKDWLNVRPTAETNINVSESDRGGFRVGHYFVMNNRFYGHDKMITVPWSNKKLDITYQTFRDKLLPGENEEWMIKISGPDKDKVSAEMLASMYDASLDAFKPHNWNWNLYPGYFSRSDARPAGFGISHMRLLRNQFDREKYEIEYPNYRRLKWLSFNQYGSVMVEEMASSNVRSKRSRGVDDAMGLPPAAMDMEAGEAQLDAVRIEPDASAPPPPSTEEPDYRDSGQPEQVRTNLDETAFFFPQLMTDENGDVLIKFTMKEALTKWKFMGLSHTKDLKFGLTENEVVTQKDLMVFPNLPRFFRQGDQIYFSAKVNNVSDQNLAGNVSLQILDFLSRDNLNSEFSIGEIEKPFEIEAGKSAAFSWALDIPAERFNPVLYRIVAKAGKFSDGEEALIPVISNRMLVTETMPLPVKSNQQKMFDFKRMQDIMQSPTLVNHNFELEFTSNPAWYAVQALPYLMEYPHQCAEQVFSRFYANQLATHVANRYPEISTVFNRWKATDSDALLSNLSKNQDLKSALLEETPWVLDALSEEQQKKNIALLFDLNKMSNERDRALNQLQQMQLSNGGFSWFPGGRDNWYITQYIVEGMGHLAKLNTIDIQSQPGLNQMMTKAVRYIDARVIETYRELQRRVNKNEAKWEDDHLSQTISHYLYARSFFKALDRSAELIEINNYYLSQAELHWTNKSLYVQGLLALATSRWDEEETSNRIVKSIRERSIVDDELGRYWKSDRGYFWYQLPIERQSLMIELFGELTDDQEFVDELRVWLLKNKQTNRWETTKSTASAVYALLMQGDNWLASDDLVEIEINGQPLQVSAGEVEPGTGYFKKSWNANEIGPSLGSIQVKNPNEHIAWGAVYWQYFEDLDKIDHFEETPVKLLKEFYVERPSDRGPKAEELTGSTILEPGDKVLVRLIVESDRAMEFMHLKDMRASGLEPIDVLSGYRWQGGLGYYQSTKDLATHFFIDYLPRGRYVIEYDLRVAHRGDFSNGISSMQCMYAPEFTAHSEGTRLKVGN